MAITGNSYCSSAWNGFILNLKHVTQFYITIQLAHGFIQLGVFMIVLCNFAIFTGLHIYAFNDSGYASMPTMPSRIDNSSDCKALKNEWDVYYKEVKDKLGP